MTRVRAFDGRLERLLRAIEPEAPRIELELPEGEVRCLGRAPARARVVLHDAGALDALLDRDALRLGEAHLDGRVAVEGDLREALRVVFHLSMEARWRDRLALWLRLRLRDRIAADRESIAFHYDRPAGFFLPWLGSHRCYSHGLYEHEGEGLDTAMERKLRTAVERLGLEPGMDVLDMGGGWGCFVEYAGLRGIRVHAITISREQYRLTRELIESRALPCRVELVDFWEFRPGRTFDAAVFMGTLEHNPEYGRVFERLGGWLAPGARVWADFCAQRRDTAIGPFLKRHLWPGPVRYVDAGRLVREIGRCGFNVHELVDDTLSYAWTVRDWGDALERESKALSECFGERAVRAFLLFLRGSELFLTRNETQAYHLVAGRGPRAAGPFVA